MSTFNQLGFDQLYIKGELFDIASFKGEKGKDQTASSKGPTGAKGKDKGFEFNTINTTDSSTEIVLPDAMTVSYDAIILKSNGKLPLATEGEEGGLKFIAVKTSDGTYFRVKLYNNEVQQVLRFTKATMYNFMQDGVLTPVVSQWVN